MCMTLYPMKSTAKGMFQRISIICIVSFAFVAYARQPSEKDSVMTVKSVDLNRYAGKWYEISKIPNRFQRQCAGNTTAEYVIRDDGRIGVTNRCKKKNGELVEAQGVAEVADSTSNAKLRVSFVHFLWRWWFWGDYWIIGLGRDYDYAIVGTPGRKYGWVLGRSPAMDAEKYESIEEELSRQGYNPEDFVKTQH